MITVFGSINVDLVMRLDRLPGRGETVQGGEYFVVQGGKGANQACAAARATSSATVSMIGAVGSDDWADFSVERLKEANVDLSCLQKSNNRTGCAFVCVDAEGENCIAVANGANLDLTETSVPNKWLGNGDWVVLQMETPHEENWTLIDRARSRGAKVVLNLAPVAAVPENTLRQVDALVLNEIEARATADFLGMEANDISNIARVLSSRYDLLGVVSLGAAGAVASKDGAVWKIDAMPISAVDTTGAGDAFTGCLVASLEAGHAVPDALHFASVGAGLSCMRVGAQTSFALLDEIKKALPQLRPARRAEAADSQRQ